MALQDAGTPIKISEIQTEFGGLEPIRLSEYYRGGGYVDSSITVIPGSGYLGMGNFYSTRLAKRITVDDNTWFTGKVGRVNNGFNSYSSQGSILNGGTIDFNSCNITITAMYWIEDTGWRFNATLNSGTWATDGWETMTISRTGQTTITLTRTGTNAADTNTESSGTISIFFPSTTPSGMGFGSGSSYGGTTDITWVIE